MPSSKVYKKALVGRQPNLFFLLFLVVLMIVTTVETSLYLYLTSFVPSLASDCKKDQKLVHACKARYAVLFQIWTFPSKPEDEEHIGPTATYDKVICPGFQHDITVLQIQGYNISYNRHTSS